MVARAGRAGIDVTAAFENEFYLAQEPDGTYVPFISHSATPRSGSTCWRGP